MKRLQKPALAVTAFLLCVNWSMDQGNGSVSGGGTQPAVNFIGTITDNTGKTFNASYINISGLYKQIPVYAKPINMQDGDYNPTINIIRLDLAELAKIEMPDPDRIYIFKDKKYSLINAYLKNNPERKHEYLIENSKHVFCNQVNGSDPIERELEFSAVRVIIIEGYVKKETEPTSQPKKEFQNKNFSPKPAPVNNYQPQQRPTMPENRPVMNERSMQQMPFQNQTMPSQQPMNSYQNTRDMQQRQVVPAA